MTTGTVTTSDQTDEILTDEELVSIMALVEELDDLAPTPCGPYTK